LPRAAPCAPPPRSSSPFDDRLVFAREHDPVTGYEELVVRDRDDL
jgi:hypothetical protein